MLLLESTESPYAARIERAASQAGLTVQHLHNLEATPPDASVIGVGPSFQDPLQVARHQRTIGGQALLVFFTGSSAARDALQAELLRDPFLCTRYELIEVPPTARQLASRMGRMVERRLHCRPSSGRRRSRRSRGPATHPPTAFIGEPYLANIVAHASDAILTTDDAGRVITWNRSAERVFGFAAETAVGQPLDFLEAPGDSARQLEAVAERVFAADAPEEARLTFGTASGGSIELAANVAPVRDAQGVALGLSIIARAEPGQQHLEEALQDARRQKDEFLAIMSHELRTPLTSILGYTDMLLRGLSGPLAPLTNKYLGNVRSAGDRLLELVNGVLDYTRLEAGADRLDVRATDLAALVSKSAEHFRTQAESRQIDLRVVASPRVGRVLADGEKIEHVLRSFLGNALKFTPTGGWIAIRMAVESDLRDSVRVSVADSGIGLRAEQRARVWERFYQGDASLTRPYGGMGLGLSIARHLVSLHGGTVGVDSSGPGTGSTFWFSLPLARTS